MRRCSIASWQSLGIPTVPGRVAAIQQHVLETPAPVVADALGYGHKTTTRAAAQAAAAWSRYERCTRVVIGRVG